MYTKSSSQNTQPRQNLAIELVVIVLCMAVVYSAVRFFLDRSNYSKGNEAYRRVDCSVAIGHFDSVINNWRIADIGGYAALSQQEKSECLDFNPALNQEQAGNASQAIVAYKNFINNHNTDTFLVKAARDRVKSLSGLRQISSPNKAQSRFISEEYVPIVIQPLHKTERHCCAKRL